MKSRTEQHIKSHIFCFCIFWQTFRSVYGIKNSVNEMFVHPFKLKCQERNCYGLIALEMFCRIAWKTITHMNIYIVNETKKTKWCIFNMKKVGKNIFRRKCPCVKKPDIFAWECTVNYNELSLSTLLLLH